MTLLSALREQPPSNSCAASARFETGSCLRIAPGVSASIHEGGLVLLQTRTGKVFQANRVGARIWQALEERADLDGLSQELVQAYGIPLEQARQDIREFLDQLKAAQFVVD